MQLTLALLCALLAPAASLRTAPLAARPALRPRAHVRAQEPGRYDDPILDSSLPDPVYDTESGYKGKVSYGFSTEAEKINGRFAMMGFTICFLQEAVFGKGTPAPPKKRPSDGGVPARPGG